jgi:putative ABC transport system permease protein
MSTAVPSTRVHSRSTSIFARMLLRATLLRSSRVASALLAITVAAAVATAMLTLYMDAGAKLHREFRNYGANIILSGKETDTGEGNAFLPPDALARADAALAGRGIAAPVALVVARTSHGQPVVVAGTDFDRVQQLDRWWSVSAWPKASQQALIGVRATGVVSPGGQPFDLTFRGRIMHLIPAGTVQTGGAEDSRIYLSLADFVNWTGVEPSTIEVAASGSSEEISAIVDRLAKTMPEAEVRPVRQILQGEARVLARTHSTLIASTALIIVTAALCVLSTLLGWVFDRRRDFAIMKALGASTPWLNVFFAAEAAILGTAGAVIGFVIGIGLAEWIGRANFHAVIIPRYSLLPAVLAGSIAVTLISAIVPISRLRRVQPAVILRGE